LEGIREEVRAGGEAFGGCAEGGPPAGAGFFKKQELGPILRTDEPGGDHPRVIEDQEVVFLK
jgi:hypothetical protein